MEWGIWLLIIGALGIILGMAKALPRSLKSSKTLVYVVSGVLVIAGLSMSGWVDFSSLTGGSTTTVGSSLTTAALCTDKVAATINLNDKYTPTTTVTDKYCLFAKNKDTGAWSQIYDDKVSGDSVTLDSNTDYQVLASCNSSSAGTTYSTWQAGIYSFKTGCGGAPTESFSVPDVKTSQVAVKMINTDDNQVNSATVTDVLSASTPITNTLEIQGTAKYDFGVGSAGSLFCLEYNNTGAYDDVVLNIGSEVSKPSRLTTASGSIERCWAFNAINGADKVTTSLSIEPSDVYIKGGAGVNMTYTVAPGEYFVNTDTGLPEFGYEDNDHKKIGVADVTGTLYFE